MSTVGILMIPEPGAAAVAGVLVLGRPMATSQIVGTVLVVAGGATRAARG